jgi:hypothetical protein
MGVPELQTAFDEARRRLELATRARDDERRRLVDEATAKIDAEMKAKHGPLIVEARAAAEAAKAALEAGKVAEGEARAAALPQGVLVEWTWSTSNRWNQDYQYRKSGRSGLAEVCTPRTQFGGNKRYGLPSVGEVFIRLLKNDGKPGTQFAAMTRHALDSTTLWLPEGQEPPERPAGHDA